MMALILSVGFVVDDAIVMLENIYRHVEMGEDPLTASLVGSREIGFTIVSMTLSLAAVFIPVLFMGGVLGRLFREFSVTICASILISGVVSVTLTPMLCSLFLKKPHQHGEASKFGKVTERGFDSLLRGYDRTLQIVLRHRPATMAAFVGVLALTVILFIIVPKGFIPEQDTDQIAVTTEAAQGTSYDKLVEYQGEVADIIRRDPNVEGLVSTVGGSAAATLGGPNLGQIVVHLKPRGDRKELATDIIAKLRPLMANVVGMDVYMQNPPTVRIGGQVSKSFHTRSSRGPRGATRRRAGCALESARPEMTMTPGSGPQVNVEIDRRGAPQRSASRPIRSTRSTMYGRDGARRFTRPSNARSCLSSRRSSRAIRRRCRCSTSRRRRPRGRERPPRTARPVRTVEQRVTAARAGPARREPPRSMRRRPRPPASSCRSTHWRR
jgi:HAE1 family hydrophobic/amphiphilic exporter-1